jgi:DNA-directed RNA polymerase sigma subunit (sigma70/sigma32)
MSTAKEQLAARVAAMTEDEAREALSRLDVDDAPLSADEDAILRARLDAADRGEFRTLEDLSARLDATRERILSQRKAG